MGLSIEIVGVLRNWTRFDSAERLVAEAGASLPYGSFNAVRERLALHEGFSLSEMQDFGGGRSWGDVPQTLVPLLRHADDTGSLSWQECEQMEPRLREIAAEWDDVVPWPQEFVFKLASQMRIVVRHELRLEFR